MKKIFATLTIAILGVFAINASHASNKTYDVKFSKGATSATYKGTIQGYDSHDYVFYANKGQQIYPKLTGDVVGFVMSNGLDKSIDISEYSADLDSKGGYTLPYTGSYTIRVGQMRAMARRGRAVNYGLTLNIQPLAVNEGASQTVYHKTLYYPYGKNRLGFDIKQVMMEKTGRYKLTITPLGYSQSNAPVTVETDKLVYGTEVDDLNRDGYPELMVYSGKQANKFSQVLGYSSNQNKSISQIAIPDLTFSQQQSFQGNDDFAIVEGKLIRRFSIASSQARHRQLQYKLVNGEASRKLVVDKVLEF